MKTPFTKKTMIFSLAAIFIFGAILIPALLQKSANPTAHNQAIPQTALATIFAPKEYSPVVTLKSAQASSNTLKFTLAISGLELVKNSDDFDNIICEPHLKTNPPVQWVTKGYENQIPEKAGDPILVTYKYEYSIETEKYQNLSVEMTLTIGPCGLSGFQESNATPYPRVDLIANYKLAFTVPIK
jgi:hypothetical protein